MIAQNQARTLFKGGVIITMDPAVSNLAIGDVLVEGDRIVAVGPNIQTDGAQVIDASEASLCPASSTPTITCGWASCGA
jgi:5-methylthioadenosine/S-adenosylhomocysteine deaminase